MPQKRPTCCLLIGDAEHAEFRPAIGWLAEQVQVVHHATPMKAIAAAETLPVVEMIVLAQSRPGQISTDEVEALHRLWPLAKLFGLLGSWCEGEGRSGRPWPGVWRIPAYNFIARMDAVLDHSPPSPRSRSWQLPRLTSDAERFYCDAAETLRNGSGVVLVAADTRDAFESLADGVQQAGFTAIWQPVRSEGVAQWTGVAQGEGEAPAEPCTQRTARPEPRPPRDDAPKGDELVNYRIAASIWDATRGNGDEWRAIRNFAHSINPAPLLITLGFPRNEDFQLAGELSTAIFGRSDGIIVLAKPFQLAELCGQLVDLTGITVTTVPVVAPGAGGKGYASSTVRGGV